MRGRRGHDHKMPESPWRSQPRISARKVAEFCWSRHQTMVWFTRRSRCILPRRITFHTCNISLLNSTREGGAVHRLSLIVATLLVVLIAAGCASPSSQTDAKWVTLIDGGSGLDNCPCRRRRLARRGRRGAGRPKTDKANSYLITKNAYPDFRIRAEFWASDDANSVSLCAARTSRI